MSRKSIAGFLIFLLAAALACAAGLWWKFSRGRPVEASAPQAQPARQPENSKRGATLAIPPTPVSSPAPTGITAEQTANTRLASSVAPEIAGAKDTPKNSKWKIYSNPEYGFEIEYPAEWLFDSDYENNYGKPPSRSNRPAAYAGETRNLFRVEIEGANQPREGGGDVEDAAMASIKVTGTSGILESWGLKPGQQWYLVTSTPEEWMKLQSSPFGGNHLEFISIGENGFTGRVEVARDDEKPERVWGEAGGAYRILPSGRVLLIDWERMNIANDFSYRNYFLPMLASFKLLQEKPKK